LSASLHLTLNQLYFCYSWSSIHKQGYTGGNNWAVYSTYSTSNILYTQHWYTIWQSILLCDQKWLPHNLLSV